MLPRPSVPALPHFVSYAASTALFRDLFSCWCRRSSCHGWITVMDRSSASRCASLSDYSESVINSSAQMVFSSLRFDHITPLLRQLHWLKVPKRIDYKLALLVYKCLQSVAPSYLADDLCRMADVEARHRLHSALSPSLVVRHTQLSTYGNRAFPVAASRVWNSLPHHVTSAQSLPVFCSRQKTHPFSRSFR